MASECDYQSIFQDSDESTEARYDFQWTVNDASSGNDFGQQETRDGDNTQGSYYVQLPDGRLQTVNYYVNGDSGFVADVTYQGEARYPESQESYEVPQRYAPPQPQRFSRPQPTYSSPESDESDEDIIYVPPPQPTYAPPQPTYAPPRPTYAPPQPTYAPPSRNYIFPSRG